MLVSNLIPGGSREPRVLANFGGFLLEFGEVGGPVEMGVDLVEGLLEETENESGEAMSVISVIGGVSSHRFEIEGKLSGSYCACIC